MADVPVIATALLLHKRPRDVDVCYSSEQLEDQTSIVKRICRPLTGDASTTSISERSSEASGLLFELNLLDETREELVQYGVMRGLEAEIIMGDHPLSTCIFCPEVEATELALSTFSQESNLAHEFSLGNLGETASACCSGEHTFELPTILESISRLNESSLVERTALISGSIDEIEDRRPLLLPSADPHYTDIGYLLEASDDELGIGTTSNHSSAGSETNFVSGSLLSSASISSNTDAAFDEPWHDEWECTAESFYELIHALNPTDNTAQEWFMSSTISPLEASSV